MGLDEKVSPILALPHSPKTKVNPHILTALCFILTAIPSTATDNSPLDDQRQPSPGHTTYHSDPTNGDDANTGVSHNQAWRSFRGVNRLRLAAGDRIEVIAPGSFDHSLMFAGNGTKEAPVEARFAPGSYHFHPTHAQREAYQISNTNSDPEGRKAVGILVKGAKHLRISGPNAFIHARGKTFTSDTCMAWALSASLLKTSASMPLPSRRIRPAAAPPPHGRIASRHLVVAAR